MYLPQWIIATVGSWSWARNRLSSWGKFWSAYEVWGEGEGLLECVQSQGGGVVGGGGALVTDWKFSPGLGVLGTGGGVLPLAVLHSHLRSETGTAV